MANTYLIDIGLNDSTQDVARKCNANFRRLSSDQSRQSRASVRQEAIRTDKAIADSEDKLYAALSGAEGEIKSLAERVEELEAALSKVNPAPHVGTWMFCDADPNELYPGTTWVRVAQGTFLMASGSTYANGGKYGSNTHTLTVNEMPRHNHAQRGRDPNAHLAALGDRIAAEFLGYSNNPVGNTFDTGGSQPHNNIPQSIAAPLWHRTA